METRTVVKVTKHVSVDKYILLVKTVLKVCKKSFQVFRGVLCQLLAMPFK